VKNWVTVDYSKVDEALEWAKKNCPGYITNDYHRVSADEFDIMFVDFFFVANATEDIVAFRLRFQ
jgi:hypothetical protein